jgi:hypothetical protein
MDGTIIVYDTSNLTRAKKTSFGRKLYGYTDKSNNGQYEYHRPGLLDEIPSRKLVRGVVIVREQDADKVIELIKDYNAETYKRKIELTPEDLKTLSNQE